MKNNQQMLLVQITLKGWYFIPQKHEFLKVVLLTIKLDFTLRGEKLLTLIIT